MTGPKPLQPDSASEEVPMSDGLRAAESVESVFGDLSPRELLGVLGQVMNLIPGPLAVMRRDGTIVYANGGAKRMGPTDDDRPLHFVAPEDRARASAAISSAFDAPQGPTLLRLLSEDGERIPHLFSFFGIPVGDKPRILSFGLDVSELTRAQEELQRRLTFEIMVTALASRLINLTTDEIPSGMRDALVAVCEFTGVDRGLVLSFPQDFREVVVTVEWARGELRPVADRFAELQEVVLAPWVASLRSEAHHYIDDASDALPSFLADIRRRAGLAALLQVPLHCGDRLLGVLVLGTVDREVSWNDDTAGLVQICSEMFANSVDRLEKGRALRMRTSEIRSILDGTEDGLLVIDGQGRVLLASRRFGEIWGFAALPERGMPMTELLTALRLRLQDPSQLPQFEEASLLRTRRVALLQLLNGRIVEFSPYPLLLPESAVGVAWRFRDVTAREELEAQLRQAQKLEAVGQLASGIAHDFNNILFTISATCEITLLRGVDEDVAKNLQHILAGTRRAATLTRQLLAFSRKQALETRAIDLNRVIADIHTMLTRLLGPSVELRLELGEQVGIVRADKGQIEQVLLNLVVNARDAMPKGGEISIRTSDVTLSPADAALLPGLAPGPHVLLSVVDRGKGMSEAVLARIFDPFFTTKAVGEGTGLGLATVFGIVKQHNGAIHVESELNVGSEFRVFLPRSESRRKESFFPAELEVPPGRGETILLVEDEALARRMTADALSQLGYQVISACDGHDALRKHEQRDGTIDLLLTDFVLPHVNGAELAQRLSIRTPGLLVVFMSGHALDALFARNENTVAPPFLQKPFGLAELARTLRRVLDSSSRLGAEPATRKFDQIP